MNLENMSLNLNVLFSFCYLFVWVWRKGCMCKWTLKEAATQTLLPRRSENSPGFPKPRCLWDLPVPVCCSWWMLGNDVKMNTVLKGIKRCLVVLSPTCVSRAYPPAHMACPATHRRDCVYDWNEPFLLFPELVATQRGAGSEWDDTLPRFILHGYFHYCSVLSFIVSDCL